MNCDAFSKCHPTVNFLFFVGAIGMSVVIQHPAYLLAGMVAGATYYLLMTATNWILLAVMLLLLALTITVACFGQLTAAFIPVMDIAPTSWGLVVYTCYLLISTALHIKEDIQWHISRSKI